MKKKHTFFIQKSSIDTHTHTHTHTHIYIYIYIYIYILIYAYRLLRGRTVSGSRQKINLFGPSLIQQLRLLGSQQHPQSGVLLTSFSTWGTENSLAEINLESTGGDKGLYLFLGIKNWQTLAALWAGALSFNKKKSREQNAAGRTR